MLISVWIFRNKVKEQNLTEKLPIDTGLTGIIIIVGSVFTPSAYLFKSIVHFGIFPA